ncbi:MAG: zinc-ribbon domain-containing protein [Alphaproteobacteria bacterium]|nr:zinc-ribbon domain-containing protein [Alphaproteobacteria bacterium]
MILTCPSCQTRYFADDSSIGANGRTVRCASCSHTWFCQGPLVLDQNAPDDLLPAASASERPPLTRDQVERMRLAASGMGGSPVARLRQQQAERERRDRVRVAIGAWTGAGVALAASAAGAVVFREDIATMWPNAAGAFAAVGLDVNVYGLEFSDLDIDRTFEGPTPVLVVRGAVRNIGADEKSVPVLRLALRDAKGEEVYSWLAKVEAPVVQPGGAAPFTAVLDNPPSQAVDLEVTFASAKEAVAHPPTAAAAPKAPVAAPMPPAQPPIVAPEEHSDEPLALGPDQARQASVLGDELPLRPATSADDMIIRAGPLRPMAPDQTITPAAIRG